MCKTLGQRLAILACQRCGSTRMFLRSFRVGWDALKQMRKNAQTHGREIQDTAIKMGQRWHGKMELGSLPGRLKAWS
jgi:hypothetical protein